MNAASKGASKGSEELDGAAMASSPAREQHTGIPLARIARAFGAAAGHYDQHAALQRAVADRLLARISVPAATMLEYAQRIGRSLKYGLGLHPEAKPFGVPVVGVNR